MEQLVVAVTVMVVCCTAEFCACGEVAGKLSGLHVQRAGLWALWKRQTTSPFPACAGLPYQVCGAKGPER